MGERGLLSLADNGKWFFYSRLIQGEVNPRSCFVQVYGSFQETLLVAIRSTNIRLSFVLRFVCFCMYVHTHAFQKQSEELPRVPFS